MNKVSSFLSKLKNVQNETKVGGLVFLGAIALLWWNEGRAVKTSRGLESAREMIVSLSEPIVKSENDEKLVHVNGLLYPSDSLRDEEFEIIISSLKYKRKVQFFQWEEHKTTSNSKDSTGKDVKSHSFSYSKIWSSEIIDSDKFHDPINHKNEIKYKPFNNKSIEAKKIKIGDFVMDEEITNQLDEYSSLLVEVPESIQLIHKDSVHSGHESPSNTIYFRKGSSMNPQIGDVRIRFYHVPSDNYSIIAKQSGKFLNSFTTENETEILIIKKGNHSAEAMLKEAESSNKTLTWFLRIFGFAGIYACISFVTGLAEKLIELIPVLRPLISGGVKMFALLIASVVSVLVVGISWIYYRPLLGGVLIAIGLGVALFFYKRSLDNRSV